MGRFKSNVMIEREAWERGETLWRGLNEGTGMMEGERGGGELTKRCASDGDGANSARTT